MTVNWTVPGAVPNVPPVVTPPNDLTVTLEASPYDFSILTEGIDYSISSLKSLVRDQVIEKFPLVGDSLDIDAGFISKLENQFVTAVQTAISASGGVDSSFLRTACLTIFNCSFSRSSCRAR